MPFGKGGRLFHWLQTKPGTAATNAYFTECFKKGYGEGAERINIKYRNDISADNKSEVSKGLAVDTDLIFDSNVRFTSDIFAEKNIKYLKDGQFVVFNEDEVVANEYFENIGQFEFPERLENFELFHQIFIDFVGHKSGLVNNVAALENRSKELPSLISAFIQNDAEYKKARNSKQQTNNFEYRFPIFIAEGLCYLEKILIPELFKS
jgi:head-tail adaptor